MKRLILVTALLASICMPASARQSGGSNLSRASEALAAGSAVVVGGSMLTIGVGASLVVASVQTVAEGVVIVFEGASEAGALSLRLSGKAAEAASVVAGSTVQTVALASGTLLVASGKVLAFVPNELGKALLHQARVPA